MPSQITTGYKALLDSALSEIEEIPAADAIKLVGDPNVVIVDLRDPRELENEGKIPGSFHAPRGMIEFWIDPASPYFKPVFGEDKKFVFHCAAGWRSALATQTVQRMGLKPVAHIKGGLVAWKEAGGPVEGGKKKEGGEGKKS